MKNTERSAGSAPSGGNTLAATLGTDPGPRPGAAGAGSFYPTLNGDEQAFFADAREVFSEVDSVSGTISGEDGVGLGPTFNGNGCAMCHSQPAIGGSSPGQKSPQNPIPNPQVALATLHGATNKLPSFITASGPVREVRFISTNWNDISAPLSGGVQDLFTIQGRSDAPGCKISQPDFAGQLALSNVIFRIPTPLFGLGLVENTADAALQANLATDAPGAPTKASLGIGGRFNTNGNDGTITRFGWKAQNKSLLIFSGEAYNVEQGVTNELFGNERATGTGCKFNTTPEDKTHFVGSTGARTGTTAEMSGDVVSFAGFARLLAPPAPATLSASASNGSKLFDSIGCVQCHSRNLTTDTSPFTGMSQVTYHPYSDFALHHMGSNLADGISQGNAVADEFRTAPLWGVGQRLFFMHDGRASDLGSAIQAHSSSSSDCVDAQTFQDFFAVGFEFQPFTEEKHCGSEANTVVSKFNGLSASQQTDLLNFLRSL